MVRAWAVWIGLGKSFVAFRSPGLSWSSSITLHGRLGNWILDKSQLLVYWLALSYENLLMPFSDFVGNMGCGVHGMPALGTINSNRRTSDNSVLCIRPEKERDETILQGRNGSRKPRECK